MWAYIVGRSSLRGLYVSSQSSRVNRAYAPSYRERPVWCHHVFISAFSTVLLSREDLGNRCWGGQAGGVWRNRQHRSGSVEVSGRRGLRGLSLSMGLQKVNYVLVGGSLCHRLGCLSILKEKQRENVTVAYQRHCSEHSYPDSGSVVLV